MIALLYELGDFQEQIYTDGRELPERSEPNLGWATRSGIGRTTTLVVETAGFNDRTLARYGWGHPHSERSARYREVPGAPTSDTCRFRSRMTIPETLTRPLTLSVAVNYAADSDMLEYVCGEDERDTEHLVGTRRKPRAHPSPAVLDRYVGDYKFRDGVTASRDFFGADQIVSVLKGQLYLKDFPLIPQNETSFDSTEGTVEFHVDSSGRVSALYPQRGGGRCPRY